jgi:hypothetical protein
LFGRLTDETSLEERTKKKFENILTDEQVWDLEDY